MSVMAMLRQLIRNGFPENTSVRLMSFDVCRKSGESFVGSLYVPNVDAATATLILRPVSEVRSPLSKPLLRGSHLFGMGHLNDNRCPRHAQTIARNGAILSVMAIFRQPIGSVGLLSV